MTKTQFLAGKHFYHAGNIYQYFPSAERKLFQENSLGTIKRKYNDVWIPVYTVLSIYPSHFTAFFISLDDKAIEIRCNFCDLIT